MSTTLAILREALTQNVGRKLVSQYNRSAVTANLLEKDVGSGPACAFNIEVGTGTGVTYSEGQLVGSFQNDTPLRASLDWKEYGDAVKLSGLSMDASAGDPNQVGESIVNAIMGARTRTAAKLNTDIFTGDGTSDRIIGLAASAGPLDSTGTYAGKDRATYTQWAGNKLGNSGVPRAVSRALLDQAFDAVSIASGKTLSWGVTSPTLWRAISALMPEKNVLQEVVIRNQRLGISMGYAAIEINGAYLFKDSACPAGSLFFLNDQHIGLKRLPFAASRKNTGKFVSDVSLVGTPQEQQAMGDKPGSGALGASLLYLPFSGNAEAWMLQTTVALWCDKPNAHCWITDLAA